LLHLVCAGARIVHHYCFYIIVFRVVSVQHSICDIRYIVSSIALSCDINFLVVQIKGIQEILEKSQELRRYVCFASCGWCALRKASSDWLLDPDHVGQIDPGIRILDWLVGAILPKKRSILLKEAFERGASGASVEPDGYFVLGSFVLRWEVPEVELASLVSVC